MVDELIPVQKELQIGGETITITPIKVRELTAFAKAIEPLVNDFMADDVDYLRVVIKSTENVIAAVCIALRKERDWVESLGIDQLVTLAAAIVEVNSDFFINRILPSITSGMQSLENLKVKPAGQKSISSSARQD